MQEMNQDSQEQTKLNKLSFQPSWKIDLEHPLAQKIRKEITRASHDFGLIEDGDKIQVCVSGGKDSSILLALLTDIKRRAQMNFELEAVILDQKLDVRVLEFRQRHLGRVLHRLRGDAGVARRRKRQDEPDLDLPGADRKRLLLRSRGACIRRAERIGKIAGAGARAKQRRAEDKANRRPPGRT